MSVSFTNIACCIDESEAAERALAHAGALRALSGGRLSVVHVVAPTPFLVSAGAALGGGPVPDVAAELEAARLWLEARVSDVPNAEPVLLEGEPAAAACAWARDTGVDVLVAASHRGLVERILLGSFAGYLVHHAPCAVLLVPPGAAPEGDAEPGPGA